MKAKLIVKWAGGKRQLLEKLIEFMPTKFNNYFEPFVGGGALLFELMPAKATINDVNKELLAIYKSLEKEDSYKLMLEELDIHEKNHSEEYYYLVREQDRKPGFFDLPIWQRAARTIYLNKSCYNGLYRVNSKGYFNVPSGKKKTVKTYEIDNMDIIHKYFSSESIRILEGDFEEAVADAKEGDFVYFDPPYDPFKDKNSFTAYTKYDFTKEDQIRLSELFKNLSSKGVYVMLSNHNTKFINELYSGFNINVVYAKRMINSNSNGRGNIEEVIITNY